MEQRIDMLEALVHNAAAEARQNAEIINERVFKAQALELRKEVLGQFCMLQKQLDTLAHKYAEGAREKMEAAANAAIATHVDALCNQTEEVHATHMRHISDHTSSVQSEIDAMRACVDELRSRQDEINAVLSTLTNELRTHEENCTKQFAQLGFGLQETNTHLNELGEKLGELLTAFSKHKTAVATELGCKVDNQTLVKTVDDLKLDVGGLRTQLTSAVSSFLNRTPLPLPQAPAPTTSPIPSPPTTPEPEPKSDIELANDARHMELSEKADGESLKIIADAVLAAHQAPEDLWSRTVRRYQPLLAAEDMFPNMSVREVMEEMKSRVGVDIINDASVFNMLRRTKRTHSDEAIFWASLFISICGAAYTESIGSDKVHRLVSAIERAGHQAEVPVSPRAPVKLR